jgi:hypothetical protein
MFTELKNFTVEVNIPKRSSKSWLAGRVSPSFCFMPPKYAGTQSLVAFNEVCMTLCCRMELSYRCSSLK